MRPEARSKPREVERSDDDAPGESFEAFFAREFHNVLGLAVVLSKERAAAEDIAQEAFAAAHRRWTRVARYDDPGAWVRRVVANLAVSAIRRRTREARALLRLRGRRQPTVELPEPVGRVWDEVSRLPRRQAQCVALYYYEDRPVAEIAEVLDMSESTVRVHLHKGREALARRIGDEAGEL